MEKYFQKFNLSKFSKAKEPSTLRDGKRFGLALLNLERPARGMVKIKLDGSSGARSRKLCSRTLKNTYLNLGAMVIQSSKRK